MKTKHYMLVFTLGVVFTTARAQQFTLKGGLNMSTMLFEVANLPNDIKSSAKVGFHGGASFEYLFTDNFSLEAGLLYMQKGGKIEIDFSDASSGITNKSRGDYNLHYIDIPLQAKYRFGNRDVQFFLALGPYMGIGLDGEVKATDEFMGNTETITENIGFGKDTHRLDLGLCGGVGIEYSKFVLALNYAHGFNNIVKSVPDDVTVKNRVFSVSLGYIINKR